MTTTISIIESTSDNPNDGIQTRFHPIYLESDDPFLFDGQYGSNGLILTDATFPGKAICCT